MSGTGPAGPIVVVGGGLAGGTLVEQLRELAHDGPVTVVCGEPHPPYERPPLTKSLLRGESRADETYLRSAQWYAEHDVRLITGAEVTGIDLAAHQLRTTGDDEPFGRLVLATGCRARRLPIESTAGIGVHHLRTLADAEALRDVLVPGVRLLVVGAGWIGLEVAASARTVGAEVIVVEPAPQPLAATLGVTAGEWFAALHREHGVDLRTGLGFSHLDGAEAVLGDGSRVRVDHVVVGIGALPNDDLARDAGLAVDGGVLVDAALRTSHPDVWAIGDVAAHLHPRLGTRVRVEHWQNAKSQGAFAARALAGDDGAVYDELPSFFSDQYDAGLEFFGHLGAGPDGAGAAEVSLEPADDGFVAHWRRDGAMVATAHVNQWGRSEQLAAEVAQGLA